MIGWSSIWKNKARGPKKPAPSRYSNATPLAMRMCGHSQESANLGLQWHVISMYAPSFFNGSLIARMGAGRVAAMRLIMMGVLATIGLGGIAIMHFWWSLILLGVGQIFGFLGASALILECHRPEEKTRVQSLNDFVVFGVMAIGSFSSGGLLSPYGWNTALQVSLIPLALSVVALAFAMRRKRGRPGPIKNRIEPSPPIRSSVER